MEYKTHRVDQLLHDRDEAATKAKRSRGPYHIFWQAKRDEIDRLLALPRMTMNRGGPAGSDPIEYEIVVERVEASAPPVPDFKIGDVVQLKSGGPGFTVTGFACLGRLELAFFEGEHFEEIKLHSACLQAFDPAKARLDIPF